MTGWHGDTRSLRAEPRDDGWVIVTPPDQEYAEYPAEILDSSDLKQLRTKDLAAIIKVGIIFLAIVVLGFILNYLQANLMAYTGQKIIFNIRQDLFTHLEGLSISFLTRTL